MSEKYFLYSQDQFNEKKQILEKSNKTFIPGSVVVNGIKKDFTMLSDTATIPRFYDAKVIAKGNPSNFTYTMPKTVKGD